MCLHTHASPAREIVLGHGFLSLCSQSFVSLRHVFCQIPILERFYRPALDFYDGFLALAPKHTQLWANGRVTP